MVSWLVNPLLHPPISSHFLLHTHPHLLTASSSFTHPTTYPCIPPRPLQTWWSQSWSAADSGAGGAPAGRLLEACWGPDSRTLLLAYDSSPQVGGAAIAEDVWLNGVEWGG